MTWCLDTNVIIGIINRRVPAFRDRLKAEINAGAKVMCPSVGLFELRYGIAKSNQPVQSLKALAEFLAGGLEIVPFETEDAEHAGEIRAYLERQGTPIGSYDILIAAQARRRGAVLVTGNQREFERVPRLVVEQWD